MPNIFDLWSYMIYAGNGTTWFVPSGIDLNDGGESVYNVFKESAGKTPIEVINGQAPSDGKMIQCQLTQAHALAMYRSFLLRNITPSRAFIISSNLPYVYPQACVKPVIDSFGVEGKERTR